MTASVIGGRATPSWRLSCTALPARILNNIVRSTAIWVSITLFTSHRVGDAATAAADDLRRKEGGLPRNLHARLRVAPVHASLHRQPARPQPVRSRGQGSTGGEAASYFSEGTDN